MNVSAIEMQNPEIRDIRGQTELQLVEELQKETWGIPDIEVVPLTQLVAAQTAGGVLLGAFDGESMVGFVYGFAGFEHGEPVHHSHMLAVKPAYRNFDLGRKLKLAQRERVLALGIGKMSWTFDPLQSLNAYFNFGKLGVFADRYFVNFYGEEAASFLHQTGTDRLWVTWDLTKENVYEKAEEDFEGIRPLVRVGTDEFPLSTNPAEGLAGEAALIEIPGNINELVKRDDGSAAKWRGATRRAFTAALKRKFLVAGFRRTDRGGVYLLRRGKSEPPAVAGG